MIEVTLIDIPVKCRSVDSGFRKVLEKSLKAQELLYINKFPEARLLRNKRQFSRGVLSLLAHLLSGGVKASYFSYGQNREREILAAVRESRFVGINAMTVTYTAAIRLLARIKDENPAVITILGGSHPTYCADECLENDAVDFVVRGAGENPLRRLIEEYPDVGGIAGLSYKTEDKKVRHNKLEANVDRANILPAYDRLPAPLDEYKINLAVGDGCPFRCTFCTDWRRCRRLTLFDPETVTRELLYLKVHLPEFEVMQFFDSVFTWNPEQVKAVCRIIRDKNIRFRFLCDTVPAAVNQEIVEILASAGFIGIKLGVETDRNDILKVLHKPHTLNDFIRAADIIHEYSDALVTAYWMSGLPGSDAYSMRHTAGLIRDLMNDGVIDVLSHKLFIPYPGTDVFERPGNYSGRIAGCDWDSYDRMAGKPVYVTDGFESLNWVDYFTQIEQTALNAYCRRLGLSEDDLDNYDNVSSYKYGYCKIEI